ncbi:hypothetical protein RhiJN_17945 [Ceratobasidium sp. AG-Ba]|nr:hypothetical protein RhiJN_17945 [Ceratobasidium sp. AG-Ba]
MFRSKITLSHLLVLACIATNAHATPKCLGEWEVFQAKSEGHDVCKTAEDLLANHCLDSVDAGSGSGFKLPNTTLWYKVSNFSLGVSHCTCTSTVWNLLTACAGCQRWTLSVARKQDTWPNMTAYANKKCPGFNLSSGGLQPQPDNHDEDWNMVASWAASPAGSFDFDLGALLERVNNTSPTDQPVPPSSTDGGTVPTSTASTATGVASSKPGPNIGAIVGGIVGGIIFLGAIIGLLVFLRRRKRRARDVAPSSEFLKPEYYASPPLLPAHRDSEYRDDIEEEALPQTNPRSLSWMGGAVVTRRHEDEDDMLPPFTQGTYIGPSPHEKGQPERRHTDESDATATSNTHLLSSSSRPGTAE